MSASSLAQPNFLIILSDDHGAADSGAYGNPVVKTPNIDQLASQGIRFDAAFTTEAICTPSRTSLYTGLYPMRHGAHRNHTQVKKGTLSLPHYMAPLGYRVYLAGKTHIGPDDAFPFERLGSDSVMADIADSVRPMHAVFHSDKPFVILGAKSCHEMRHGVK